MKNTLSTLGLAGALLAVGCTGPSVSETDSSGETPDSTTTVETTISQTTTPEPVCPADAPIRIAISQFVQDALGMGIAAQPEIAQFECGAFEWSEGMPQQVVGVELEESLVDQNAPLLFTRHDLNNESGIGYEEAAMIDRMVPYKSEQMVYVAYGSTTDGTSRADYEEWENDIGYPVQRGYVFTDETCTAFDHKVMAEPETDPACVQLCRDTADAIFKNPLVSSFDEALAKCPPPPSPPPAKNLSPI